MTSEVKAPSTVSELAVYVGEVVEKEITPEQIAAFVATLPRDDYVRMWLRAKVLQRVIGELVKATKARAGTDFKVNEEWTDSESKIVVAWARGQSDDWKVEDPGRLRRRLAALKYADNEPMLTEDEINAAVPLEPKPNHNVLNKLRERNADLRELIDDMRKKPETAADLRERGV